jgi:hypothetical protein
LEPPSSNAQAQPVIHKASTEAFFNTFWRITMRAQEYRTQLPAAQEAGAKQIDTTTAVRQGHCAVEAVVAGSEDSTQDNANRDSDYYQRIANGQTTPEAHITLSTT